ANWTDFTPAPIAGYTPSQSDVAAVTVQNGQKDVTVDITYTANDQTTHVVYVDGDGHTVKTDKVTGKTDQTVTVDVKSNVPAAWELTKYQVVPKTITFTGDSTPETKVTVQHHHSKVSHTDPVPGDGKTPTNKPINGAHDSDLNQTITRTIKVKDPHTNKVSTTKQVAKIFRDATVDDVTGEVTYGDWSSDDANWTDFTPAPIAGYTPSQSDVAAVTVQNGQKDVTVDITYTANDQTTHVVYVDGDGHTVKTDKVTGKTDQTVTVDVKSNVPAGWELTKDQVVPKTITFTGDSTPETKVTVQHHHSKVSHTDPVPGDGKTPTNKPINGAHDSDLNQTITRTIKVHEPGKDANTITQTAKIFRDATVDDVTGEVTYTAWSTDATDWAEYDAPVHAGYTVSQAKVDAVTVADGQKDVTVDITYTANDQTTHVVYKDASGNVIKTDTVTGKTDQTVDSKSSLPAGWKIADSSTVKAVPATITFKGASTPDTVITVDHAHRTIQPTDPIKPDEKTPDSKTTIDGGHASDLNKTVTRTINITDPTTKKTTTTTQPVTLTRTVDLDEVTGHVTNGSWSTGRWDEFDFPAIDDYTPNQSKVSANR